MEEPPSQTELADAEQTWREIEDQLDRLAGLARSAVAPEAFFRQLLDGCVDTLAAVGGAVWICDDRETLRLAYHINLRQTGLDQHAHGSQHIQLLNLAIRGTETIAIPPLAEAASDPFSGELAEDEAKPSNPSRYCLLLGPVLVDHEPAAVIEIVLRPGRSPAANEGSLRFLDAVCELAADFQRSQQLRSLRNLQREWTELDRFARRIHESLDLKKTAAAIVNDGRRLIGCDRVSLIIQRGSGCRVSAISGVDTFDRRSRVVRLQQRLARLLIRADEPLYYDDTEEEVAPEVESLLQEYLDASSTRALIILPLTEALGEGRRQRVRRLGALVVESFEGSLDDRQRSSTAMAAEHSRVALMNALDVRCIPLMPLWRTMARIGWLMRLRQLPKTLTALAIVGAGAAALIAVPADFDIEARGQLQPTVREHIFAPDDGVIDRLEVDHGADVVPGQTLAVLRQADLDIEFERINGERKTVSKRLAAIQAARLTNRPTDPESRTRYHQLTAEEEEIKEQLRSLDAQYEIFQQQRSQLEVASPIHGRVITWDLQRKLTSRPVVRGQTLLTVADLEGSWVIEAQVPDDQVGHVLEAQQAQSEPLRVSFMLETEAGVYREGLVRDIAMTTDRDQLERPSVLITIDFDAKAARTEAEEPLRPGAGAMIRIHCGERRLGYVWFRGVIEAVERWWF